MKTDIITSRLLEAAKNTPDKIAFTDAGTKATLSFSELAETALKTVSALSRVPNAEGKCVAILAGRNLYTLGAMFGVIAAGGWYVNIDAELPRERIDVLLSVAEPCVILDTVGFEGGFNVPVIDMIHMDNAVYDVSLLPEREVDSPMFGIFTSGSTGMPKLVVKSLGAMSSFIEVYCKTFGFNADDVFGNQIPFYFDASTKDIFSTVYLGASCVVIPAKEFSFPVNLVKTLNDYKVSRIVWVPSALGIAAKFKVFSAAVPEYLKTVLFVGERMPVKYLNEWIDNLPSTKFVNLYGSTEVAGNSTYYVIDRRFEGTEILPIGLPFDGSRVFILSEDGKEADEGEICVAGPGLAIGYYKDKEKTDKVFKNMTIGDFSGRVYFSGDIGRKDENGRFVCISRADSQIKHMGHRIELGEIESVAGAVSFVHECCCFYDSENEKIILFFSADTDLSRELRQALNEALPKYEVPHKFRYMQALPHNRNGKLDRAAMKGML